jgi:hypothetical protein
MRMPDVEPDDAKVRALSEVLDCVLETAIQDVGEEEARRQFAQRGRPRTAQSWNNTQNAVLLLAYWGAPRNMSPWRLAGILAGVNKSRPRNERLGPRGSCSPSAIGKHISRLLKDRRYSQLRNDAARLFYDTLVLRLEDDPAFADALMKSVVRGMPPKTP